MSVTLKKYCETSQSKFAKALKVAMEDRIFIPSDEIKFVKCEKGVRAHVFGIHALSCYDFAKLHSEFDGIFWQVWPSSYQNTFDVVFFIDTDEE